MSEPRVLVVGIDAACFEQLDPMLDGGDLPNLSALVSEGVSEPMETTTPPWTPSAWPSVVTGSRPWTHGVYDFYHYGADEPSYVSAREVRVPFLWEILSEAGHSSIVVNVPVTHPLHSFDGSLVPGYIAPEGSDCLVDSEAVSMAALDEDYHIYPDHGPSDSERIREYRSLVASRADVAAQLDRTHDWSFMMVQFQCPDTVFHTMGDHDDAVRRVYDAVDDAVGRLRSLAGEDAHVLVVSDHGMQRYERIWHCNSWLRDQGRLETTTDASRWAWNEQSRTDLTGDSVEQDRLERALSGTVDLFRRAGVTPRRVERALARVGLDDAVLGLVPESVLIDTVASSEHVDWASSAAYCRSSASLGLRCNVEGRDDGGVIPAEEFDAVRASLVDQLRSLTDPDGEPVFERVYDRHRRHGADVANERSAPDIVVRPNGMSCEVSDVLRERSFTDVDYYNHSFEGLFVGAGAQFDPAGHCAPTTVDVAPTVLSLFGLSPLSTMDGRVLDDALVDIPEDRRSLAVDERDFRGSSESDGVAPEVEAQLKEMGYVE